MLFQPTFAVLCVSQPLPKPLPRSGRGFNSGKLCIFWIEVDGEIHTEKEIQSHDEGRTGELERFGIKVIRFANSQILNDSDLVVEKINATIKELATTS